MPSAPIRPAGDVPDGEVVVLGKISTRIGPLGVNS
jgi:hypothetical protein